MDREKRSCPPQAFPYRARITPGGGGTCVARAWPRPLPGTAHNPAPVGKFSGLPAHTGLAPSNPAPTLTLPFHGTGPILCWQHCSRVTLLGAPSWLHFLFCSRRPGSTWEGPGPSPALPTRHCPLSCPHRRLRVSSDPGPPLRKPPPSASSTLLPQRLAQFRSFRRPSNWLALSLHRPPRLCLHVQGRGLPSPLAFGARPATHVLVDSRRWDGRKSPVAVYQRFAHSGQPVEHDSRCPALLQAEHAPGCRSCRPKVEGVWQARAPPGCGPSLLA